MKITWTNPNGTPTTITKIIGAFRIDTIVSQTFTKPIVKVEVHQDGSTKATEAIYLYYADSTFGNEAGFIGCSPDNETKWGPRYMSNISGVLTGFFCNFYWDTAGPPKEYEFCYGCHPYDLNCNGFTLDDRTVSDMSVTVGAPVAI